MSTCYNVYTLQKVDPVEVRDLPKNVSYDWYKMRLIGFTRYGIGTSADEAINYFVERGYTVTSEDGWATNVPPGACACPECGYCGSSDEFQDRSFRVTPDRLEILSDALDRHEAAIRDDLAEESESDQPEYEEVLAEIERIRHSLLVAKEPTDG